MSPGMVDYQYLKSLFMAKIQQFKPHFYHIQQSLPRLSPGMPWPVATYGLKHNTQTTGGSDDINKCC